MIEKLLDANLITPKEFKLYRLFRSELGIEVFNELKEEIFWEEPDETLMTEGVLGFYDGRRSVLRGIKSVIEKVETIIKKQHLEVEHD
jgi:hypothetical protein